MAALPKKLRLKALGKQWKISYVSMPGKLIMIEHPHRELVLYGKKYSKRAALHLITRWIKLKSHEHLNALIKKLNRRVKAKYKKLVIGSHDAQWGSYSSTKTISLNYKLIFLPPALVRHIIFHELCHVTNMSHSEVFWRSVAKYDRLWRKHKAALNEADCYIPWWVVD